MGYPGVFTASEVTGWFQSTTLVDPQTPSVFGLRGDYGAHAQKHAMEARELVCACAVEAMIAKETVPNPNSAAITNA